MRLRNGLPGEPDLPASGVEMDRKCISSKGIREIKGSVYDQVYSGNM